MNKNDKNNIYINGNNVKIITFYLLNDNQSQNTMMILNYLNNNIKMINDNGFKVKFNLIKKEDTKKNDFIEFINKKKISNIPCIINETDNEVISGMDDILQLLNKIGGDSNINVNKKGGKNPSKDLGDEIDCEVDDDEERYNSFMQNYLYNEMTKPDNDDERFEDDENDNKKDLCDKLRALEKQRKSCGKIELKCNKKNVNNKSEEYNVNEDNYEDKVVNKLNNKFNLSRDRDIDQDSLTKKLLEKLEDD
jgi:hypothetical protein